MEREKAQLVRDEILKAIYHLNRSILLIEGFFPEETRAQMRRAVGMSIGRLDDEFLSHIFALHPDLDHLANPDSVKRDADGSLLPSGSAIKETHE